MNALAFRMSPSEPHEEMPETFGLQALRLGVITQDGKDYPIYVALAAATSELCKRFLETLGDQQRNIKKYHYASMLRDVLADQWLFTGETWIFGTRGQMLDAKHRATLVVESGKTIMAIMVFGVPESSFVAIDLAAKRTGGDTLRMSGHKSAVALAAAASWVFKWQQENLMMKCVISPLKSDEIIQGNPSLIESVSRTSSSHLEGLRVGHGFPAFCHFLFSRIEADLANDFFSRLGTDTGHEDKSPILALRRTLINRGKKFNQQQMIVAFFKAWNIYRQGGKADMIRALPDEAIPELI